jgi:hypothetical protein
MTRLALIGVLLSIAGCGKDSYSGFYYPDSANLFNDIESPYEFDTVEQCRTWITVQKRTHNPRGERLDDYECGLNCDKSGGKPYVCEDTVK